MADTSIPAASSSRRTLITIGLMAATLMQVLDQTIANVALPHMQASLSATQESVAWVLTSYILAAAICMPLTGWLTARLGARRLFMIATMGFTAASVACGLASTLTEIVIFRLLQGAFGAFLVPLSQSVMYNIYPREKHAQAMTIWAMGVMIGPIVGPAVGGWLTDMFDWRYVFFINLPFGILAIALTALMPNSEREDRRFDLTGFILLGMALASLQLMLDRGAQLDWLDSWEIRVELGVALAAAWLFGVHAFTTREPIFNLTLFRDPNFVVALVFILIISGILVAGSALLAPMMQSLLGYSATDAGLATMPRGLGTMVSMIVAGVLIKRLDSRIVIASGLALTAWSLWIMTGFSLEMDRGPIIVSGFIQGLGFGLTIMPLNILAFSTLAARIRTDGTALYSLTRSLGGSVAISIASATVARNLQVSHSDLSQHVTTSMYMWIERIAPEPGGEAILQMFDLEINRQALMISYIDVFYLMFWATVVVIPLTALMRRVRRQDAPADDMVMAD